jgi:hypothetical protein
VNRTRSIAGMVAGVLMLLSSAAHSLLGWPVMRAALAESHAPADLVQGLAVGWHFGGASILTFACIVLWIYVRRLRGAPVPRVPAAIISVAYLVFGAGALAVSGDPFFLVFIVPGLLLAAASFPRRDSAS